MLRTVVHKVDTGLEQRGHESREIEIQRKNQKEILERKITVTEMKKLPLMGLLVECLHLKKEISELEGIT